MKPRLKAPGTKRLTLKCFEPVSSFAFKFSLRRYTWVKVDLKWKAKCRGTYLGMHASEVAAARAYNVEAGRVGRPLNIILPAGAAGSGTGAGPKRAAPKKPEPNAAAGGARGLKDGALALDDDVDDVPLAGA